MKEVEVIINQDGTVLIEGRGFVGPECEQAMNEITQALGVVTKSQAKPEYRQVNRERRTQAGGR